MHRHHRLSVWVALLLVLSGVGSSVAAQGVPVSPGLSLQSEAGLTLTLPPFSLEVGEPAGLLIRNETPEPLTVRVRLTRDGQAAALRQQAETCPPVAVSGTVAEIVAGTLPESTAPAPASNFPSVLRLEAASSVCIQAQDGRSARAVVWSVQPPFVARGETGPSARPVYAGDRLSAVTDRVRQQAGCDGARFQGVPLLSASGTRAVACMNGGRFLHFVGTGGAVVPGVYLGLHPRLVQAGRPQPAAVQISVRRPVWWAAVLLLLGVGLALLPTFIRDRRVQGAGLLLALQRHGLLPLRAPAAAGPYMLDLDVENLDRFLAPTAWPFRGANAQDAETQTRALLGWPAVLRFWQALQAARFSASAPAGVTNLIGRVNAGQVLNFAPIGAGTGTGVAVAPAEVGLLARALAATATIAGALVGLDLAGSAGPMLQGTTATPGTRQAHTALKRLLEQDVPAAASLSELEAYARAVQSARATYDAQLSVVRPGVLSGGLPSRAPAPVPTQLTVLWRQLSGEVAGWNTLILLVALALALTLGLETVYFRSAAWGQTPWDFVLALAWGGITAGVLKGVSDTLAAFARSLWRRDLRP